MGSARGSGPSARGSGPKGRYQQTSPRFMLLFGYRMVTNSKLLVLFGIFVSTEAFFFSILDKIASNQDAEVRSGNCVVYNTAIWMGPSLNVYTIPLDSNSPYSCASDCRENNVCAYWNWNGHTNKCTLKRASWEEPSWNNGGFTRLSTTNFWAGGKWCRP